MKRIALVTIACLAAAAPAAADQAQLGWRTLVDYDSKVTAANGGQDDFIFTFGPEVRIDGERERFEYHLDGFFNYEQYVKQSQLGDWRHDLRTGFSYVLSPRVRLQVNNSFQQLPQIRVGTVDQADVTQTGGTTLLEAGRVRTNVFTTGLTVTPTSRLVGTSQLTVVYREFQNPTLNAQNTISTSTLNALSYRLSERQTVGAGFRFSSRDFQARLAANELTDATTQTWEIFASWIWQIDSRSTFSARVGPAFSSDNIDRNVASAFPEYPVQARSSPAYGAAAFLIDPAGCPAENLRPGGILQTPKCQAVLQQDPASMFYTVGIPFGSQTYQELTALRTGFPVQQVGSSTSDATNVFFQLSIDRNWDRLGVTAGWTRSDSQTQALGSSTIVDGFFLESLYTVSPRTRLLGRFRFTRRSSDVQRDLLGLLLSPTVGPIAGVFTPDGVPLVGAPIVGTTVEDGSFKQQQDTYSLQLRLTRDIGRYSTSYISLALRRQEFDLNSVRDYLDSNTAVDSWGVTVGFTYHFKPVDF